MPHALLLSPDDQAVNAITGVLEEMSVSCERPLDGVSAAKKLNSQSFDLVLVDCENLPAAKLIFDVCRRGKNGTNPVPIAIVDGRAGLPTAFRLGAELILTKPVAKDQARSTFRTAVSRLRKEEPARPAQAEVPAPEAAATQEQSAERALAAAAGVSSQPVKMSAGAPVVTADLPSAPATEAKEIALPAAQLHEAGSTLKPSAVEDPLPASKPMSLAQVSDDPVLAELENGDPASPSPALGPGEASRSKGGNALIVTLIVAMAGGGAYAAWMYQPKFRALVQPQIKRLLDRTGMGSHQKAVPAPTPVPTPPKPTTSAAAPSTASPTNVTQPDAASAPTSPDAAPGLSTVTPASITPASASPKMKAELPVDSKKTETASSAESKSPGSEDPVLLSSKGAEKRLVHSVPPTLPVGTSAAALEGTVVLEAVVNDSGKVESVRLLEGNPALADAAIRAVKQWRYRPFVRDRKTVPFQTVVLVDFQRP